MGGTARCPGSGRKNEPLKQGTPFSTIPGNRRKRGALFEGLFFLDFLDFLAPGGDQANPGFEQEKMSFLALTRESRTS